MMVDPHHHGCGPRSADDRGTAAARRAAKFPLAMLMGAALAALWRHAGAADAPSAATSAATPQAPPVDTCLWVVVDGDPPSEGDVATVGAELRRSPGVSLGNGPGCVTARIAVQSLRRMGQDAPGYLTVVAFNLPGDELNPYIANVWGRERPEVLARAARMLIEQARARSGR